jgi:hypothetical protein
MARHCRLVLAELQVTAVAIPGLTAQLSRLQVVALKAGLLEPRMAEQGGRQRLELVRPKFLEVTEAMAGLSLAVILVAVVVVPVVQMVQGQIAQQHRLAVALVAGEVGVEKPEWQAELRPEEMVGADSMEVLLVEQTV